MTANVAITRLIWFIPTDQRQLVLEPRKRLSPGPVIHWHCTRRLVYGRAGHIDVCFIGGTRSERDTSVARPVLSRHRLWSKLSCWDEVANGCRAQVFLLRG